MGKPIIVKFSYWSGLPLLFAIILIGVPFMGTFVQESNYYINFNEFEKENVEIDSLVVMTQDAGTVQVWGLGKIDNHSIRISHGHKNWATDYDYEKEPIIELYENNNKYLDIWYWEGSDRAYFVEPGLEEMNFKTVWLPDLKRLSILLFIYLFHAYCQRVRKKYELENPEIDGS